MEKRREISAPQKPNAPARRDVERVLERIEALGLDWHTAVEQAELSRATGFRLLSGHGSTASLRELEEWVAREEGKRRKPRSLSREEQDEQMAEWVRLGEALREADPARFAQVMSSLPDLIEATRSLQSALHKMFRATPEGER